ncbi:SusD/RagB family nutrient-binding outer membrane lipoprotein [Neolewinella antarctica]|uniref:SusD/RagB family nutrient-binding outer membrane lipoprotein n=1 Tax=Neolewinella antarctica TaxID=442734 RepID=A0ABX0XDR9_9BACT|nr:SusD/RagB family nutrient-binding outer membrane lipoprotein [Neolewinella antarctica]NJC27445.1 hypothetical protein [Neolewinella antarctica]
MNISINKYLLALCAGFFLFASCETFLGDDDFNVNPNKPVEVTVSAQLPEIGIQIADLYGGAFSRFNCMLVQQVEGVERQWSAFNQYTGLTPVRFDAAWSNTYENILIESRIARGKSVEGGFNHYEAVFNVLESFMLLTATDVWDDMPYTEATGGLDNLSPVFDSQESIYAASLALIDRSITLLEGDGGPIVPGGDDVYYGGSATQWAKAARALRARTILKQGDLDGAAALASSSFESAADNLAFQYPDANNPGQWSRFNRDRTGDLEFHPQFGDLLTSLDDTMRLNVLNPTFNPSHPYLIAAFNQELITYREMQFIIAEASLDADDDDDDSGYEAYLNGIRASFDRLGLSEDDYDNYVGQDNIGVGADNLTLENVMTQKYIALYLQPEAYSDWRRTDIPNLEPTNGNIIPVRWHYSQDEYLFNTNAPNENDVNIYTDNVGWDN